MEIVLSIGVKAIVLSVVILCIQIYITLVFKSLAKIVTKESKGLVDYYFQEKRKFIEDYSPPEMEEKLYMKGIQSHETPS